MIGQESKFACANRFTCYGGSMKPGSMIAIGVAIGVAIGAAMDNIAGGIGIGIALAIALSLALRK